jgi:hypothetical protein
MKILIAQVMCLAYNDIYTSYFAFVEKGDKAEEYWSNLLQKHVKEKSVETVESNED